MQTLNYNKIQKIEMSATEKLLKYISSVIQDETLLDKLDFVYPDFGEHTYRLAFNVWISIDFVGKDGKTFIEKFLEEKSPELTTEEAEILIEKNKSNISLFEILDINGESIIVLDLLQNENYTIWDPELLSSVSEGDIIFARIGNLLGHVTFIGDISYLPSSLKSMFIEEAFVDFNHIRFEFPMLTLKDYLKKYSANLYKIYTNCVYEAMETEEDVTSTLYDELDEFEAYLQLKTPRASVRKYVSNLMDFFEYYLIDENLTLYDIDQVDFDSFFREGIKEGFIISQEDLNAYISTLKKYLGFLSNKNHKYKDVYNKLLDISKNRFELMNQIKLVKSPFTINRDLSNIVSNYFNEDAVSLIMDYDKFILYLLDRPLDLTEKNKYIKRKNLIELNDILEFGSFVDKKSPNQVDFPIIHMFYKFSLRLGLLSIQNNTLSVAKKGSNYLRLRDEDKYTLFFEFIWSNDFIAEISSIKHMPMLDTMKNDLAKLLSSLNENISYEISTILPAFSSQPRLFFAYYIYLQYLGIIKCNLYPNYEIIKTSLGNMVLNFLESKNKNDNECRVVELKSFKRK
ncbi:site-specific integrase [Tissierella sp.]|uniref:site-specific integrase n=1 Tax=Tissierella sp. TaxID=41274 RepID=UPI0028628578|nr:site-specific integrase [Tissierella sp.]MDR7856888.1 site-specific integrase [Tissierella sp.]